MKKIAKLSLVAAVAVAGLTSANASSLEEAIKGVDVSGMVRYRFTETKKDKGIDKQENDYDIELTAKVPVNDNLKAVIKLDVDGDLRADDDKTVVKTTTYTMEDGSTKEVVTTEKEPSDAKPSVNVEDAYFSYTNSGFVVNAGKQNVPGPLVDALNGTGVVAMAPLGPVTAAAGYFNATKAAYNDIYAAALMAGLENINLSAWYADLDEIADAYSLAADGTFGPAAVDVRYSEKDVENSDADVSVLKVGAGVELGMFELSAGFAKTGDDNAANGGAALDGEADAVANDFQLEQKDVASEMSDATAWKLGAAVSPVSNVTLGLDYLTAEYNNGTPKDVDYDEYVASVAYKMSKNFKISSFYSVAEDGDVETNKGRLELKYTF